MPSDARLADTPGGPRRARDALRGAEVDLAATPPLAGDAAFHCQQAAEKALKALLTRHQIEFARTHSIGELLQLAEPAVPGLSMRLDAARELTRHAIADRYPGEEAPVARESARGHVGIAQIVLDAIRSELHSYLEAGPPTH